MRMKGLTEQRAKRLSVPRSCGWRGDRPSLNEVDKSVTQLATGARRYVRQMADDAAKFLCVASTRSRLTALHALYRNSRASASAPLTSNVNEAQ